MNGIAVHSKVYKSISSESLVERDFCSRGYQILARRHKIRGCEVDLIFFDSSGQFVFVEVKAGECERVIERWQQSSQRLRQQRMLQFCLERGFHVSWILAIVDQGQLYCWNLLD